MTYKLLRPDFFVVTAETATGKSYRRITQGPDGALRGFAIGYDKAIAPELDKLTIAVANSYDAFPVAAAATAGARPAQGAPVTAAAGLPPGPRQAPPRRLRRLRASASPPASCSMAARS